MRKLLPFLFAGCLVAIPLSTSVSGGETGWCITRRDCVGGRSSLRCSGQGARMANNGCQPRRRHESLQTLQNVKSIVEAGDWLTMDHVAFSAYILPI